MLSLSRCPSCFCARIILSLISPRILCSFCTIFPAEDETAAGKPREEESSANTSVEDGKPEAGEAGGRSLRRACSLSDLNKPSVPRRILPAPPPNGKTVSPSQPPVRIKSI